MNRPFIFSKGQLERVEAGLEKIQLALKDNPLELPEIDPDALKAAILVYLYLRTQGYEGSGRVLARLIIEGYINVMIPPGVVSLYDYFNKKIDAITTDEDKDNVIQELITLARAGTKIETLDEKFNVNLGSRSKLRPGYAAGKWTPETVDIIYSSLLEQAERVSFAYWGYSLYSFSEKELLDVYGDTWKWLTNDILLTFVMLSKEENFPAQRIRDEVLIYGEGEKPYWLGTDTVIFSPELLAHETGHFMGDVIDGKMGDGYSSDIIQGHKDAKKNNLDKDGKESSWGDILYPFPQGSPPGVDWYGDEGRHWSSNTWDEIIAETWAAWTFGYLDYSVNPTFAAAIAKLWEDNVRKRINQNRQDQANSSGQVN